MDKSLLHGILIYSDGACSGNPGAGGWGAVIALPEGEVIELGGAKDHTTNNEMELTATIKALEYVKHHSAPVFFYTDSTYVIRGITQWIWGWRKNGWKTAEGNEVANQECWQKLSQLVAARPAATDANSRHGKIDWRYSRGHVGTPGNERCDEIAVSFSKKKWIDLFQGPLLKYPYALYDVPENHELPEMKPKEVKAPAYSYLSNIGGNVCRHSDWASCERRVKGQSGAKFKKAMSSQDEIEILKSWGLGSDHPIKS